MNVKRLAKEHGIGYQTLYMRLRRGWSLDKALATPVQEQTTPAWQATEKKCTRCGEVKPLDQFILLTRRGGHEYTSRCRVCDRQRTYEARQRLRLEVLAHYAGDPPVCQACGFANTDCLDLHHVNGDGRMDRMRFEPSTFYRRIKQDGYPDDLTVLCRNCNWLDHLSRLRANLTSI